VLPARRNYSLRGTITARSPGHPHGPDGTCCARHSQHDVHGQGIAMGRFGKADTHGHQIRQPQHRTSRDAEKEPASSTLLLCNGRRPSVLIPPSRPNQVHEAQHWHHDRGECPHEVASAPAGVVGGAVLASTTHHRRTDRHSVTVPMARASRPGHHHDQMSARNAQPRQNPPYARSNTGCCASSRPSCNRNLGCIAASRTRPCP
jgi:hypothetical protein